MKNIFIVSLALLSVTTGCKKNTVTDHSPSVKGTVWVGSFSYTSASSEPYSLQVSDNGSFTWREYNGSFPGTWKLEGKQLTLTFTSGKLLKADISNDTMLVNIQNNVSNGWFVTDGQLNKATGQTLSGTFWKSNSETLIFLGSQVNCYGGEFSGLSAVNEYSWEAGALSLPTPVYRDRYFFFGVLMPSGKSLKLIAKNFDAHVFELFKQ